MMNPEWSLNQMFIRINPNNVSETLDYIKSVYKKFEPDYPASIDFFDDTVMRVNYSSVNIFIQIAGYFTILAIIISCLGLLGLAAFITEQRKNEIGIRKVLGSHVTGIVLLLSKDFLKWVLISNIFAWPLAWYIMNSWLQNFAYRAEVTIWTFIIAAAIVFITALFTIGFQTVKAALSNPVNCIRYE